MEPIPPARQPRPNRAPLPEWWWEQTLQTRQILAALIALVLVVGIGFGLTRLLGGGGVSEAEEFVDQLDPAAVRQWDQLAECESGRDWAADTGNGYYGGLQIQLVTWQAVGGVGYPSEVPREAQIHKATAIKELQGWEAWPRCSVTLGFAE